MSSIDIFSDIDEYSAEDFADFVGIVDKDKVNNAWDNFFFILSNKSIK